MNLYHPNHLFLLLLIIPLVILMIHLPRRRKKRFARFAEPQFMDTYLSRLSPFFLLLKISLTIIALILIILALARPQWDFETHNFESQGLDIMICLDVSRSMDAQDMPPSRLTRAKLQTSALLDKLQGDRVGVIAYAGKATLECPLTDDYESVSLVLNSLSTANVVQEGTNISAALALAEKSFLSSAGSNILLLISDGEDLGGGAVQQARRLSAAGVRIYTLGVGTAAGSQITDPATKRTAFSKLDVQTLEQIASAGGGKYFSITPGQNELDLILQNIYTTEKGRERSKNISIYMEQYHIPALLALLFLLLESTILPLRRQRRQP